MRKKINAGEIRRIFNTVNRELIMPGYNDSLTPEEYRDMINLHYKMACELLMRGFPLLGNTDEIDIRDIPLWNEYKSRMLTYLKRIKDDSS